jgi:arylsulfatase A-like enzyme
MTLSERRKVDGLYRQRLRSLQAVDEMVGSLVDTLEQSGQLENTYVFYTSDNGYLLGEHWLSGKVYPYEDSIRVPLVVRGPGVVEGARSDELVLNNDLAPTIAELAGVQAPTVDGRSMVGLFDGQFTGWRDAILVETRRERRPDGKWVDPPSYDAIRTPRHLYVEYRNGEKELYDLASDPRQLENLAGRRRAVQATLGRHLEALKSCPNATMSCRQAENGP